MAWKRIKHPSEIVAVGDEIDVKVLKFDRERNRVSLGLKQLGDDPWVNINGRYPEGARAKAIVTNLTDYGCFAELEEGVDRKSTRLNSSHVRISYAVFCLKKKN